MNAKEANERTKPNELKRIEEETNKIYDEIGTSIKNGFYVLVMYEKEVHESVIEKLKTDGFKVQKHCRGIRISWYEETSKI